MNFFNNFNVGKKIIIGYITILTLMIMVTTVLLFSLNNVTKEFNFLVKHDQPVLSNIYLLEKLVVDMETGERGFLITGKDELKPVTILIENMGFTASQIAEMTPAQISYHIDILSGDQSGRGGVKVKSLHEAKSIIDQMRASKN